MYCLSVMRVGEFTQLNICHKHVFLETIGLPIVKSAGLRVCSRDGRISLNRRAEVVEAIEAESILVATVASNFSISVS